MMNNIQKYIDLLKVEKEKAWKNAKANWDDRKFYSFERWNAAYGAFSFAIDKAELLLLNEPEASEIQ